MLGNVNNINVITSGMNAVSAGPGSGSSSNSIVPNNGGNLEQNLELLFNLSIIEVRDEFDEKMCRMYLMVQSILANKSESQAHEELNKMAGQGAQIHEDITIGVIVSILLEPHNAQRYYRDMIHVTRDAMATFNNKIEYIICEKWLRLHEHSRKQMIWLIKELLRSQVTGVESVYYNMFRNIVGGDISPSNIALAEALLDILIELRSCYDSNVYLLSWSLFNYLRLIVDHQNPAFRDLRAKEVHYCASLLRDRFADFLWIGRDLVRLLQQVAMIPEFEPIWRDLLFNPTVLAPGFSGIAHLMRIRTPRRFIKLRITLDMEKKLNFLTSCVRFGNHRRYQDWLQKQYFNTQESQMLRCDMIRFICCSIHPSNETLASDVFPRWALIGWILSVCNSQVLASYAKLALFFDWLFFDDRDQINHSIMDIEPGILVMYYSLKNYPQITASLIDFLCRIAKEFYPSLTAQIKQGIKASLVKIGELRVVGSISSVFACPKVDAETRQLFHENFPEFSLDLNTPPPMMMNPAMQQPNMPYPSMPQVVINSAMVLGPPQSANLLVAPTGGKFANLGPPLLPGTQSSVIQMNNPMPDSTTLANFSDDEDDFKDHLPPSGSATKKLKKSTSFSNGSGSANRNAEPSNTNCATTAGSAPLASIAPNTTASLGSVASNSVEYITSIINNSAPTSGGANGNGNAPGTLNSINTATSELLYNNVANNHFNAFASNIDIQLTNNWVSGNATLSKDELMQQIEHLQNADMRTCLARLCQEKSKPIRCQEMSKLAKLLLDDDSEDFESYSHSLTIILLALLDDDLSIRIFPLDFNKPTQLPEERELKESITGPLFVMFRTLAESYDDQSAHSSLLALLATMGHNNSKVGYLLLYFLIVGNFMTSKMLIYRKYVGVMNKDVTETLIADLRCCAYDDVYMFFYLLPEIVLNLFPQLASVNIDFLKLVVCHADSVQLQAILGRVVSGSLKLLRKENIMPMLTASLEWESIEQYYVWQILSAHNVSVDQVMPILPKLESNVHSEALNNMMLFIQRESPNANMIKHLFNRESKAGDNFTVSILIHWAQNHSEKLAELIGNFISSKISSPNKRNKRTLNNTTKSQVNIPSNIENILFYLEEMRKLSKNSNFFTQEYMIIVLDQLKQFCSPQQKTKYQELFTNVPDDNDNSKGSSSSSTNSKKSSSSMTGANNKKSQPLSKTRSGNTVNKNNDSETESDSSDEDVPMTKSKANARKKRKQAIGSDSD